MNSVKLPCLFHTNETEYLKKIDMEYSIHFFEERNVTFYQINAISPYYEENKILTTIHSNGTEFVCKLKPEEVELLIKENFKQ